MPPAAFEVQELTRQSGFGFCICFRYGKVGLRLWRWQGVRVAERVECSPLDPTPTEVGKRNIFDLSIEKLTYGILMDFAFGAVVFGIPTG